MPAKRGRALEKLLLCRIPLCPLPTLANSSSASAEEGLKGGRRIPSQLHRIFQNQMLSRGRRKDPGRGNKGKRAWNASAVCRPDTIREKDRWTTRLPFHRAATPAPNCTTFPANFSLSDSRSLWTCTAFTHDCNGTMHRWIFFFFGKDFIPSVEKFFTIFLFFLFFSFSLFFPPLF